MASIPYAGAIAGNRARQETLKILQRFGCEEYGFYDKASSLRRRARRLDRQARSLNRHSLRVEQVVAELRRGATLQLSFSPRPHWRLSSGPFVPADVATTVINLPCVVGVGDTLFGDAGLSQTFRYLDGGDHG